MATINCDQICLDGNSDCAIYYPKYDVSQLSKINLNIKDSKTNKESKITIYFNQTPNLCNNIISLKVHQSNQDEQVKQVKQVKQDKQVDQIESVEQVEQDEQFKQVKQDE